MPYQTAGKYAWLRFVLLATLLAIGAYRRFSLIDIPFADNDIIGYLNPALNWLEFGELSHVRTRSFPYPVLIILLAGVFGSLKAVIVFQHLVGLAAGVLMFSVFELRLFKNLRISSGGWTIGIAQFWCTAMMLIPNDFWMLEHTIRPESISTFLLLGILWLMVKLVGSDSLRQQLWCAVGLVSISLFAYLLMPRLGFGLPLLWIFTGLELLRKKVSWPSITLSFAIPTLLFVVLMWLPERYLVRTYDPGADAFPPRQFFYSHADIVKAEMSNDLVSPPGDLPVSYAMLQKVDSMLILVPPVWFKLMGFEIDSMMHSGPDNRIQDTMAKYGEDYMALVGYYNKRLLTGAFALPMLAAKVGRQLRYYYLGTDSIDRFWVHEHPVLYNVHRDTQESFYLPELDPYQTMQTFRPQLDRLDAWHWNTRMDFIELPILISMYLYLPMAMLFALLLLLVMMFRRPLLQDDFDLTRLITYLMILQFGLVFTIALMHSFDLPRYGLWFAPVSLLAHGFLLVGIARLSRYLSATE